MHNRFPLLRRVWIVAALGLVALAGAARAQWTALADMPTPREGHMTAAVGTTIYAFGYFNGSQYNMSAVKYDGATNGPWTALPDMPSAQLLGVAATVNGKIYLIGGVGVSGSSITFPGMVTEYNPATNSYTTKSPMPKPSWYQSAGVINGKIYVWGGLYRNGSSNTYNTTTMVYDPVANNWTELPTPMTFAGVDMAGTSDGTALYSIGGSQGSSYSKAAWRGTVDGAGNLTWTAIAQYPDFIDEASAGVLDGKVYVAGGSAVRNSALVASNNTYVYNSAGDTWDYYYALPEEMAAAKNLVMANNALYMMGGSANPTHAFKLTAGSPRAIAQIAPAEIVMTVRAGASRTTTLDLTNGGILPLDATLALDAAAPWLTSNSTQQTLQPGGSYGYTLTANAGSLSVGMYEAALTLTSNDPDNGTITIPVKLFVVDQDLLQQDHNIVFEEGTGDWCGYCPYGHEVLANLKQTYGERLIALAYHGGSASEPLMDAEGQQLIDDLNIQGYPNASISRRLLPGEKYRMTNRGEWEGHVTNLMTSQPKASAAIEIVRYTYNAAAKQVTAELRITTFDALPYNSGSTDYSITAVVSEDNLKTTQTKYSLTGGPTEYLSNYDNDDVVRTVYPNRAGMALTVDPSSIDDNLLLPGTVINTTMTFTHDGTNDPASHTTFILHRMDNGQQGDALQAMKVALDTSITPGGTGGQVSYATATRTLSVVEGDTATFETIVTNGTSAPVTLELTRADNSLPSGWASYMCWNDECTTIPAQGGPNGPYTLDPGATARIRARVVTSSVGTGTVTLRTRNTGDNATHDETYTVTATPDDVGGVTGSQVGNGTMSIGANTPNPASDLTTFAITLARPMPVALDVIALDGTVVLQIPASLRNAGTSTQVLNVAGLPAGTYTVRFTANGQSLIRTLNVVR